MPKLSVITINLNNAKGLQKTIESVITQSFTDFEYIIIDGGSIDGSVDIIKQYENRITYWISEQDKGVYNAMNKGILQAKGDYCLFLNSGDFLVDHNILEKVFSTNLQEDIIYGNLYVHINGENIKRIYPDEWTFRTFLLTTIPHQAAFIKRSLLFELSLYDENLRLVADWEFFVKAVILFKKSYIHLSDYISVFEAGGISSNRDINNRERAKVLSKSPYLELLPEIIFELQKETEIYKCNEQEINEYINLKSGKLGIFLKLLLKIKRYAHKIKKNKI